MSFWGTVASVAGAGGQIGGGFSAKHEANQAARRQREFQNQMSSTAHVREVKDLKAAGLNPILSAGGSGASTPMGGMKPIQDIAKGVGGAVSSAVAVKQGLANVRLTDAQAKQQEVEAQMQQDMYDVYASSPAVKKATLGGMIGKKSGVSPKVGAVVGGASAVYEHVKKKARSTATKTGKSIKGGKTGTAYKAGRYLFNRGITRFKSNKK